MYNLKNKDNFREGGMVNSIPKHKTLELEKSRFLGLLVPDTLTFSTLQYKMCRVWILEAW
jgi:hypothetical protein